MIRGSDADSVEIKSLRAYEFEPAPAAGSVELRALRANSEADAERLRTSVPGLLAGIIAEVPGGEIEFGMGCGTDGVVALDIEVRTEGPLEAVRAEIEAVLHPVAETARPVKTSPREVVRWLGLFADKHRFPIDWVALRCRPVVGVRRRSGIGWRARLNDDASTDLGDCPSRPPMSAGCCQWPG